MATLLSARVDQAELAGGRARRGWGRVARGQAGPLQHQADAVQEERLRNEGLPEYRRPALPAVRQLGRLLAQRVDADLPDHRRADLVLHQRRDRLADVGASED